MCGFKHCNSVVNLKKKMVHCTFCSNICKKHTFFEQVTHWSPWRWCNKQ